MSLNCCSMGYRPAVRLAWPIMSLSYYDNYAFVRLGFQPAYGICYIDGNRGLQSATVILLIY